MVDVFHSLTPWLKLYRATFSPAKILRRSDAPSSSDATLFTSNRCAAVAWNASRNSAGRASLFWRRT